MRRKPGALVPLESAICAEAAQLLGRGIHEFHGYEIAKYLADERERRSLTGYGTLYRALGRLEKLGLLSSRWEDPYDAAKEGRPVRRLYSLTSSGEAVAAELRADASPRNRRRPRRLAEA